MDSLPLDLALRICEEVQANQPVKIFTQCWGCTTFSKGERSQMCGAVVACNLLLRRYKKHYQRGKGDEI